MTIACHRYFPVFARVRFPLLVAALLGASVTSASSTARAQDQTQPAPKPKKKPKKKPPTQDTAPPPSADEPKPAEPETKPTPPPEATAETAPTEPKKAAPAEEAAATPEFDITDTREDPATRYVFVGLRYRGTIIPQFLESIFVDGGATFYTNIIGAELDLRKGGNSLIPWIQYSDYSTPATLFHQKGSDPALAGNYTVVQSSLKVLYFGLDELWSTPIDAQHHWDFEYGFGVGLGIVFGDLFNNWVFQDPNGAFVANTGVHYSPCPTVMAPGTGCNTQDHQNTTTAKVGGFKEPFLTNGGSVPNVFPNIWFPTLGVRYKPIKQMQARLQVGFSLTGFWFGLSADYGLEHGPEKSVKASRSERLGRDML